jgi:uncharacterized membrane protein
VQHDTHRKDFNNRQTQLLICLAGIEPAVGAAGCLMALVGSTVIAIFWAFPQVCLLLSVGNNFLCGLLYKAVLATELGLMINTNGGGS